MRHPNIVQFYGLFDKDDQYYIVTEFVEGGSLDCLLKAKVCVLLSLEYLLCTYFYYFNY